MTKAPIRPLELLSIFVISTSLVTVALISAQAFHGKRALLYGLCVTGLAAACTWFLGGCAQPRDRRIHPELILILGIALWIRATPSLHVTGGQDQGVYTIESAQLERAGGTEIVDRVREFFRAQGLLGYYDQINQMDLEVKESGRYEGIHKPGIYVVSQAQSKYVFQFYPLHPAWMAISSTLFGPAKAGLSVVAFSILGILFYALMAAELSPFPRITSGLLALLLAISPAHAFFSKYPLSEIPAFGLTAGGLYYLLMAWRSMQKGGLPVLSLILSLGFFTCFFFTRISGFVWLPLFWAIYASVLLVPRGFRYRRALIPYCLGIFASYAMSWELGVTYSYPYSRDIYFSLFNTSDIGLVARGMVLVGIVAVLLPIILILPFGRWPAAGRALTRAASSLGTIGALGVFVAFLGCAKYGYDLWGGRPIYQRELFLGDLAGWRAFQYSVLFVDAAHFSLPFFVAFGLAMVIYARRKEPEFIGMMSILAMAWFYAGYSQRYMPYQYYGLRYQLSELFPASFLLTSIFLTSAMQSAKRSTRGLAAVTLAFAIVSSVFFLQFQRKWPEMAGADESFRSALKGVHSEDLVFFWAINWANTETTSTLRFYYGVQGCQVYDPADIAQKLGAIVSKWPGKVYLLAGNEDNHHLSEYPLLQTAPLDVQKMERSRGIPRGYETYHSLLRLYAVKP